MGERGRGGREGGERERGERERREEREGGEGGEGREGGREGRERGGEREGGRERVLTCTLYYAHLFLTLVIICTPRCIRLVIVVLKLKKQHKFILKPQIITNFAIESTTFTFKDKKNVHVHVHAEIMNYA